MACVFPALAGAFNINLPRIGPTATEYYNVHLDHYFLTTDPDEMAIIDAGGAGPGWVRTGWAFYAEAPAAGTPGCVADCLAQVSRFYGTPGLGPNSHFYTGFSDEAEFLRRPGTGWSFEQVAFSIRLPGAGGQCAPGLAPVYRLYNGRWMFNDSNHRFVASGSERERMIARGWIDEGVAFCTQRGLDVPIKSLPVAFGAATAKVLPSAECEDEARSLGPCVAINNLPVPRVRLGPYLAGAPQAFFDRTGFGSAFVFVVEGASLAAAAESPFVQPNGSVIGIHVDSARRRAGDLSSVNPLYQLRTTLDAQGRDARFFPFGPTESPSEVKVSFVANVKRIATRAAGSHAFGHPTLEFTDTKSGKNLYFTVLAYGTQADTSGEYLAPDTATGKIIVGTTFRAGSPYLRSLGLPTLHTPPGFVSPTEWGWGGPFEFRMDREEFGRVLAAARSLDPSLSAEPADYLLDNFHFNNEVFGEGEIGMNLADFRLERVRKP